MKCILLLISSFFMTAQLVAQRDIISPNSDTVSIWVNTKQTGEYLVKKAEDNIDLVIKKPGVQNINRLALMVKGPSVGGTIYKRSLQLSDDATKDIAETKDKPGHFNIFLPAVIKKLGAGEKIPVYLMLSPANDMMMISSKRIFLGNLMMK